MTLTLVENPESSLFLNRSLKHRNASGKEAFLNSKDDKFVISALLSKHGRHPNFSEYPWDYSSTVCLPYPFRNTYAGLR